MSTAHISYQGDLHTVSVHLRSGERISTDAPVDDQGRGAAFSPTDLLATSLGTCMLTLMGIKALSLGIELHGLEADITKHMASSPRRVSAIDVMISLDGAHLEAAARASLERAATSCPVALSLAKEIDQRVSFKYK